MHKSFVETVTTMVNSKKYIFDSKLLMNTSGQISSATGEAMWSLIHGKAISTYQVGRMIYYDDKNSSAANGPSHYSRPEHAVAYPGAEERVDEVSTTEEGVGASTSRELFRRKIRKRQAERLATVGVGVTTGMPDEDYVPLEQGSKRKRLYKVCRHSSGGKPPDVHQK